MCIRDRSTTYYYKAFAVNAAGTGYGVQRSFVTAAPIISVTPLTGFGTVCVGTVPAPNSFAISSTGLNSSNVTAVSYTHLDVYKRQVQLNL